MVAFKFDNTPDPLKTGEQQDRGVQDRLTPTNPEEVHFANQLTSPFFDLSQEQEVLPGQSIDPSTAAEIKSRIINVSIPSGLRNIPSASELHSHRELDSTNPLLADLDKNMTTGYLLAASFFEGATPACSIRNILAAEGIQPTGKEISSLNDSEKNLLFNETKEIISSNHAISGFLNTLAEKATSNELTRFEAAFTRGLIAGTLPTYDGMSSLEKLDDPLSTHEQKLLCMILHGQPNSSKEVSAPNVTLGSFTTYVESENETIGPAEIKSKILHSKYLELREELKDLDERQLKAVDTIHNLNKEDIKSTCKAAGISLLMMAGSSLGWAMSGASTNLNLIPTLIFGLGLATMAGVVVGGGIRDVTNYLRNIKIGGPLEEQLNAEVTEFAQQLGENDQRWIKEGIKRGILNPETRR